MLSQMKANQEPHTLGWVSCIHIAERGSLTNARPCGVAFTESTFQTYLHTLRNDDLLLIKL